MKKIFFLLICFNSVFGQIEYNFKKRQFGNGKQAIPDKLKDKAEFRVKVSNINLYLYQVEVKVNSQTFTSEPTKLLTQLLGSLNKISDSQDKLWIRETLGTTTDSLLANNCGCDGLVSLYNSLIKQDNEYFNLSLGIYDSHYDSSSKIPTLDVNNLKRSLDLVDNFESEYIQLVKELKDDQVHPIIKQIKAAYDQQKFRERFQSYIKMALNLTVENFEYETPPIFAKDDLLNISIKISPRNSTKEDLFYIPLRNDSISFSVPVISDKWKLSFSSGLFLTNLHNKKYSYLPNLVQDTASFYRIGNDKYNRVSFGFSSIAHFMKPVSIRKSIGGHLGLGIPLDTKINLFVLYGFSFAYGDKNKIIFNIGGSSAYVNRISKEVVLQKQQFINTKNPIPYTRLLKTGLSVSLTFLIY